MRRSLAVAGLAFASLSANPLLAQTAPGSYIRNQAEATYFNPIKGIGGSVLSSIAVVRVRAHENFDLLNSTSLNALPGQMVSFPHQLVNTGNIPDFYTLSANALSPSGSVTPLQNPLIYHDVNSNGNLDPGEPLITQSPILNPGDTYDLLLATQVPFDANPSLTYQIDITATSDATGNAKSQSDFVDPQLTSPLKIVKTSSEICSTPINAGDTIRYTIDVQGTQELVPGISNVTIDSVVTSGFIIEDDVPANTVFEGATAPVSAPIQAKTIVNVGTLAVPDWREWNATINNSDVIQVGLFLPNSTISSNHNAKLEFTVRTSSFTTDGTKITNRVAVDADGDGTIDSASHDVCNTITSGVSASIRFMEPSIPVRQALTTAMAGGASPAALAALGPQHPQDTDFGDSALYRVEDHPTFGLIRDGVYLELRSSSFNQSIVQVDATTGLNFILVDVTSSATGDTLKVKVYETAPNSGVFRAEEPIRLSRINAGGGAVCSTATVNDCVLKSDEGDVLHASITDIGTGALLTDEARVDLKSTVFDSVDYSPVPGAQVTILDSAGNPAIDPDSASGATFPVQTTGADGMFEVPRLASGNYYFSVSPPINYTFPSAVPAHIFGGIYDVSDPSYGRDGYTLTPMSGLFQVDPNGTLVPQLHVPLDPNLALGQLDLEKSVDKTVARFGDGLTYTLKITNKTAAPLIDVQITDVPPAGFALMSGTSELDDAPITPTRRADGAVIYDLGIMAAGESHEITYVMRVGPGVQPGEQTNIAVADAHTGGGLSAVSGIARAPVRIADDGLMSDKSYIIGSVWFDADGDGMRDKDEIGLPGARVWLEDGSWAETDASGRYSFYGLNNGLRVIRIDRETLPKGVEPMARETRAAFSNRSRFADLDGGELHRADFALECNLSCDLGSPLARVAEDRKKRAAPSVELDDALAFEGLLNSAGDREFGEGRGIITEDGDTSNGRITIRGGYERYEQYGESFETAGQVEQARQNIGWLDVVPQATYIHDNKTKTDADEAAMSSTQLAAEAAARNATYETAKRGTWLWPMSTISRDGRFMVVVRAGVDPRLRVNGVLIEDSHLGERIVNKANRAQVLAWYGVPLQEGDNLVEVVGRDVFGNERIMASGTYTRPGAAKDLIIKERRKEGADRVELKVALVDERGISITGADYATVDASVGRFAGKDLQPDTPGYQVRLDNGVGKVTLLGPDVATVSEVRAKVGDRYQAEHLVVFEPKVRDLMAVGLLDLTGRVSEVDLLRQLIDNPEHPDDHEIDGRAAIFMKGRIKGDVLMTLAYDSEKNRNDGLFRDIDPEAYYPIYSDGSAKGFEAQSRSKLYIRLEKGHTSVMWGDYRTDQTSAVSLGNVRRALTGFNARTKLGEKLTLSAFAAEMDRKQHTVRLPGQGIALSYQVPNAPIEPGSEVIFLETHDQNNPGLILHSETLIPFKDYILDDYTGHLIFKRPIGGFDANGDPLHIAINYESREEDNDGDIIAGLRADYELKNGQVWANITGDESDTAADIFGAVGTDFTTARGAHMWAEVGASDGDNGTGLAYRAGLEKTFENKVSLRGEYGRADTEFDNPDAPLQPGRQEMRGEVRLPIGQKWSVAASAFSSEDLATDDTRRSAGLTASRHAGKWVVEGGALYTNTESSGVSDDFTSLTAGVSRTMKIGKYPGRLYTEVEQDIDDTARRRVAMGGEFNVRDDTKVYAHHDFTNSLPDVTFASGIQRSRNDTRQGRTAVGVETKVIPNTDVYGEWRVADALSSQQGEAAFGVRSEWILDNGLHISPRFENVHTVSGGDSSADYWATSIAFADRRDENARRSFRVETRQSKDSSFYGLRTGWAQRFSDEKAAAFKIDYSLDDPRGHLTADRTRGAITAGYAKRPNDARKADWVGLYQWKIEDNGTFGAEKRKVHLISAHANKRFGRNLNAILSGRLANKWENQSGVNGSAQILGGKLTFPIGKRFDLMGRAGVKTLNYGEQAQQSYGVALGFTPIEDVRLQLGYNFTGFKDEDLDPEHIYGQGIVWRASVKFDEDWFGWLKPNER